MAGAFEPAPCGLVVESAAEVRTSGCKDLGSAAATHNESRANGSTSPIGSASIGGDQIPARRRLDRDDISVDKVP